MSETNTVETPDLTISSIADIDSAIIDTLKVEEDATAQRGYSKKRGFNAISPLAASSTDVLVSMGGAIMYALASRFATGDETAQDGLNLLTEYAGVAADSAVELRATAERVASLNERFNKICGTVCTLSGMSEEDFSNLPDEDRLNRVINFLENNNGRNTQPDLVEYIESQLATA